MPIFSSQFFNFTFDYWSMNPSLQVDDNFYFTISEQLANIGGFQTTGTPIFLCKVYSITYNVKNSHVIVQVLAENPPEDFLEIDDIYYSFSKNGEVNQNELLGYYKTVQFVNDSRQKAKLFAVGVEITENSK